MTDTPRNRQGITRIQPIHEGSVRKGGQNPEQSQVTSRPPGPAPMSPKNNQSSNNGSSSQSKSIQK